jgi:multiple sugar transport system substrate-binding protein
MLVRFFNSLMWQQGVDVIAADGTAASINTRKGSQRKLDQVHL